MKRLSLPSLNKVGSLSNVPVTLNLDLSLSISKQESK